MPVFDCRGLLVNMKGSFRQQGTVRFVAVFYILRTEQKQFPEYFQNRPNKESKSSYIPISNELSYHQHK